ncbi:MAG: glycine cleavage system aminomethyltransferase GcvT [Fuerstiella sp.]|nr:glycine cleavage system aminomethyltransferase GcvT [Fuerstiella sp.]MCP4854240.1 glycine cleavage system aminomethyltransferase GcvT [Fuerstiella sp.]
MDDLRRSPLHDTHVRLGARMVPFAGWEMPVQYEGIIPENKAVREKLGVFDISHMGQVFVSSETVGAAAGWLDSILTNNVARLDVGQGQYTLLLNETGGVIDDLIVYRQTDIDYFLVVNASMVDEDVEWMQAKLPESGVTLVNRSADFAGLAVQGPAAATAFQTMFGESARLPERFSMATITTPDGDVIICRTGYTGEDGFELFCDAASGPNWWQHCTTAGATPVGLGARDSLRLEKCYPLNGNDLSPDRTPLEAGLAFAVDLHKPEFVGRESLIRQKTKGLHRRLVAIKQIGKSPPPRPGYLVLSGDEEVGTLSSGGVSPNLGCGISMAYITSGHNKPGTPLDIEIRGKRFPAEVVKKPFI